MLCLQDVTTLDYPTNGFMTNGDGITSDDKLASASDNEDTKSGPAAVEGDSTRTDTDKPPAKAQAPKKAAPLKPMQLNKEFLTSGTAPATRGVQPQKLSLSTTKGSFLTLLCGMCSFANVDGQVQRQHLRNLPHRRP